MELIEKAKTIWQGLPTWGKIAVGVGAGVVLIGGFIILKKKFFKKWTL